MYNVKRVEDAKILFKKVADLYCDGFEIDNENKDVVNSIIQYLNRDEAFNIITKKGQRQSLDKGLLLMGNAGSGKTTIIEICQVLLRESPYRFIKKTCPSVVDEFSTSGVTALKQLQGNIFFDDLTAERTAIHYQDKREIMQDIIFSRYDDLAQKGWISHFTTMEKPDTIRQRYGEFVWSRLQQMCNIFILGGSSNSKDRRITSLCKPRPSMQTLPKLYISEREEQISKERELIQNEYTKLKETPYEPKKHEGLGARYRKEIEQTFKPRR